MLDEKSAQSVDAELSEIAQKRANKTSAAAAKQRELSPDEAWARKNLRWRDSKPVCDIANAIRVIECHPDFKGRFKYNEVLNKVIDKGTVMIEWRVNEVCAIIQERFVPTISTDCVNKALVIVANRCSAKP